MTQPPYGQDGGNPPGTPQYPSAQPPYPGTSSAPSYPSAPPAYPSAPPLSTGYPSAPPAYPSAPTYSPEPAYPSTPTYASAPVPAYTAPQKKSSVLGFVGLGLVVVAGVVFFLCGLALYNTIFNIAGTGWVDNGSVASMPTLTQEQANQVAGPGIGLLLSSLVGITGFILSIVATVQNKGRVAAIIGIILGVIAPFTIVIAAAISIAAHTA